MQDKRPILNRLDGGAALPAEQAEREWLGAWTGIASACEAGLTTLHPLHPRRDEMLMLARDARLAARLPAEPQMRIA